MKLAHTIEPAPLGGFAVVPIYDRRVMQNILGAPASTPQGNFNQLEGHPGGGTFTEKSAASTQSGKTTNQKENEH